MSERTLVVISVDGLRASALGAYGNTWHATPAFDRLAAESTVCSRFLARHWEAAPNWKDMTDRLIGTGDRHSLLVTDDPDVAALEAAAPFDRAEVIASRPPGRPASQVDETLAAATLGGFLDLLETQLNNEPLLAWCHLRFASGPWDAPLDLAADLLEEDDPEPTPDVAAPIGRLSEQEEPDDARFLATLRYAAQVMTLDRCLGFALGAIDELPAARGCAVAVLGTRGLALGEHGLLGPDPRPYNECRQTPLLIRAAGRREHGRRRGLLTSRDLPALLLGGGARHERVVLHSEAGLALEDDHWKLYEPLTGEPELYSKPDDAWEVNDVANREPHQVERLQAELAAEAATASEKPA